MRAGGREGSLTLQERAVELARAARGGDAEAADQLAAAIAECDTEMLEGLVRGLTRWFQLINLIEDNDGGSDGGKDGHWAKRGLFSLAPIL